MPYARVAIVTFKPGSADKIIRAAQATLVPSLQKSPGFLSYNIVKGSENRAVATTTWQTRDQAEAGRKVAEEWNRQHADEMAGSIDAFIGEVVVHADTATAAAPQPMIPIIEALYAAFNAKEIDRVKGLIEPNAKVTNVAWDADLPVLDYMRNWAVAFPDGKIEATNFIESDDAVLCEYIGRGTHTGTLQTPMGALPPTGKCVELHFAEVYRLRNGKVSSSRSYFNSGSLMRQLGLAPEAPMPRPGKAAPPQPAARH